MDSTTKKQLLADIKKLRLGTLIDKDKNPKNSAELKRLTKIFIDKYCTDPITGAVVQELKLIDR